MYGDAPAMRVDQPEEMLGPGGKPNRQPLLTTMADYWVESPLTMVDVIIEDRKLAWPRRSGC